MAAAVGQPKKTLFATVVGLADVVEIIESGAVVKSQIGCSYSGCSEAKPYPCIAAWTGDGETHHRDVVAAFHELSVQNSVTIGF